MRRLTALLLVIVFVLGSCAFAEDEPEVFSYDFDLCFHLNADFFPFRQREHAQGYADLLDLLEFRGNLSWCPETQSTDLQMEIIPRTQPSSAVSIRIYGIPAMHRVTSPLFGDKAICFNPGAFLHFAVVTRDTFRVPLPYLALLNPQTTISAFSVLTEAWTEKTGDLSNGGTVSYYALKTISETWETLLNENLKLNDWISALVDPMYYDNFVEDDFDTLSQQLLSAADGKALTFRKEGETLRCQNASGFVIWEQTEGENRTAYSLNIPENAERYVPAFSIRKEKEDGLVAFRMDAVWGGAEETAETDPETGTARKRVDMQLEIAGIPELLPADSSFSGILSQKGTLLPAFDFRLDGSISTDGKVRVSLLFSDRQEAGAFFSCEGTVTPAVREEPMAYTYSGLVTDYNILALNYDSQHELFDAVSRPLVTGLIDFLYEIPASSCQSIMDDMEEHGILQTLLK